MREDQADQDVEIVVDSIPMLRMFDITKRSENSLKIKKGNISSPDDLNSQYINDPKVVEADLPHIQKKANKVLNKMYKRNEAIRVREERLPNP